MKQSPDYATLLFSLLCCFLLINCSANKKAFTNNSKKETIQNFSSLLKERYVDEKLGTEVAKTLTSLEQQGYFNQATTPEVFASLIQEKAQKITKDKHLYIRARKKKAKQKSTNKVVPKKSSAKMLPGEIGYIYLSSFMVDNSTIDDLILKVLSSKSLIIDLRNNGGGSPDKVKHLSNYFFDKSTHLNTLYWRKGNQYNEYWTAEIAEKRLNKIPIYLLTSKKTFSAAEEFTYNLQALKRATIIGEQTGGGANPGVFLKVSPHINAFIPEGKAINPITKTNWSEGILPDIKCSATEALEVALDQKDKGRIQKIPD